MRAVDELATQYHLTLDVKRPNVMQVGDQSYRSGGLGIKWWARRCGHVDVTGRRRMIGSSNQEQRATAVVECGPWMVAGGLGQWVGVGWARAAR